MGAGVALMVLVASGCGRIDYDLVDRRADASPLDGALRTDVGVGRDSAVDALALDAPATDARTVDALVGDAGAGTDAPATDAGVARDLVMWIECEAMVGVGVPDSSGYGNDAVCAADGCPAFAMGRIGMACVLDGTEHLTVMDSPDLPTDTGLTIALWAAPRVVPPVDATTLVSRPDPSGSIVDSWALFYQPLERPMFETNDGTTYDRLPGPSGSMTPGVWAHVAATFTPPDQRRLYLNGAEVAADTSVAVQPGGRILIGADDDAGTVTHFFDGAIDDVRLYRRPLDASEIAALAM